MQLLSTRKRRRTAFVAAIAAVAIGGGIGYAFWSATGEGAGNATTGFNAGFTVASTPPTGDALSPAGPAQSVAFTVTNPGDGTQALTDVTVTVANADGSAWIATPNCSAADYAVTTPVIVYGPVAGAGVVNGTVSISMNETGVNQDACQGVDVPLYFVAS